MALHRSRVAVVGVGGVGSWAVEALARSGIGHITLIDFDHVAVSNVNRQIQALDSTLGEAKVSVLEARIRDINPGCKVTAIEDFLTEENVRDLIPQGAFDAVIDACDNARVKAALIAHARHNNIRLVVCGVAGGKSNPLKLRQSDLGFVTHDALLSRTRNLLSKEFEILPRKNGKFGVACVYLEEPSRKSGRMHRGQPELRGLRIGGDGHRADGVRRRGMVHRPARGAADAATIEPISASPCGGNSQNGKAPTAPSATSANG